MIENYKGWDITLTWNEKNLIKFDSSQQNSFNQNKKWVGIDFMGHKIYGSSLKEIRHIIDYPNLHNNFK
tara:strand:- start:179 stop:385 length:207 start_codon:yes stop_codon:yes gene_type:complete